MRSVTGPHVVEELMKWIVQTDALERAMLWKLSPRERRSHEDKDRKEPGVANIDPVMLRTPNMSTPNVSA
ncbi:hypothetical protein Y1Q_0022285 [Alligator mississippiensis]|uniref:Uncharacterized protein n=1 Tax=Alligator mississippiensis TaxID=8496 RepID=A0A151NZY7_ALLMI|nr:hypothetical protein Y1Q_0022285 [Alligator mississippiensis]